MFPETRAADTYQPPELDGYPHDLGRSQRRASSSRLARPIARVDRTADVRFASTTARASLGA